MMDLSRCILGNTYDRQIHLTHTPEFAFYSHTFASQSRILDELFALFYLLIMHKVFRNANLADFLLISYCVLDVLKFCSAFFTVPTLYSAFQCEFN